MNRCRVAAIGVFALVMGCSSLASAIVLRDDRADNQYLNLGAAPAYSSVGQVVTDGWFGSGTLIAPNWVLTAAHVVDNASNLRFSLNGTTYTAAQSIVHPNWNGDLSKGYDIGLIRLVEDVAASTGIAPAERYTGKSEVGAVGTAVGYGKTGTGETGATTFDGQKRAMNNAIDTFFRTPGKEPRLFGSDFDSPTRPLESTLGSSLPLDLEGMIAPGDSGGGLFLNINGKDFLAGINSFGSAMDGLMDSDYGDVAGYVRVSAFNAWIDSLLGSDGDGGSGGGKGNRPHGVDAAGFYAAGGMETIPEPSTLAMALSGLVGLGLLVWRRR